MVEGLSFLLLLFVAMPLKYIWGDPSWVRIVGLVHGLLFILFCMALVDARNREGWGLRQALWPFLAALVPFGPFLIDGRLKSGRI